MEIKIADAKSVSAKTTNENVKVAWNVIISDWEESLAKMKTDMIELISNLVNPQK